MYEPFVTTYRHAPFKGDKSKITLVEGMFDKSQSITSVVCPQLDHFGVLILLKKAEDLKTKDIFIIWAVASLSCFSLGEEG